MLLLLQVCVYALSLSLLPFPVQISYLFLPVGRARAPLQVGPIVRGLPVKKRLGQKLNLTGDGRVTSSLAARIAELP